MDAPDVDGLDSSYIPGTPPSIFEVEDNSSLWNALEELLGLKDAENSQTKDADESLSIADCPTDHMNFIPIWPQIPSTINPYERLNIACGEDDAAFRQYFRQSNFMACADLLDSFRKQTSIKYGILSDGHRSAATQYVAFCIIGSIQCESTDISAAVSLLRRALEVTETASGIPVWGPPHLRSWASRAMAKYFLGRGKPCAALKYFQTALRSESDPNILPYLILQLAVALNFSSRHEAALQCIEQALRAVDSPGWEARVGPPARAAVIAIALHNQGIEHYRLHRRRATFRLCAAALRIPSVPQKIRDRIAGTKNGVIAYSE